MGVGLGGPHGGQTVKQNERDKEERERDGGHGPYRDLGVPFVLMECGRCLYPLLATATIVGTTRIDNCLFRKITPALFHFGQLNAAF